MAGQAFTGRVGRSLTLLRLFVWASAVLLAASAAVLGSILTRSLRAQALDDAKVSVAEFTDGVVGPHVVRGETVSVFPAASEVISRELLGRPDILNAKVWRRDGVLVWTSVGADRIGSRFPLDAELERAIELGTVEGELEDLDAGGEAEDAAEARLGIEQVLEVYAPLRSDDGEVVGAYEIYVDASRLEESIAGRKRDIWLATAAVFGAVWALLVALVRGASRMLRAHTHALRERSEELSDAYRRLEETALEAVQALNAAVEAKDPYTVGHSVRVQRVALALGERMGLPPDESDALRFGALFHDIGKIAVPDAVLTKPEALTPEEQAFVRHHAAEGSRLLAKFDRLRGTVPVVRHHHERWDGRGYPDGLAGDEIPVAAAIVALANAWDAMTIERPYRRALSVDEALAEIQAGRGSQFAPAVVDVFLDAVFDDPPRFGVRETAPLAPRGQY